MRNEYDLLKSLTILLVVLGHITNKINAPTAKWLTTNIYMFHMPLFIAISGAVYAIGCRKGKYGEFLPFMKNKMLRLGVPFLAAAMLVVAPTLILIGYSSQGYFKTLIDIFLGGASVRHLWFLEALMWMFLAAWLLRRFKVNMLFVLPISIVASVAYSYFNLSFAGDCCFGIAVRRFPAFILGIILVEKIKLNDLHLFISTFILVVFTSIMVGYTNSRIALMILNAIRSLSIVMMLLPLARWVLPHMKNSKVLKFILDQSFGIYLFHVTFIYAFVECGCAKWPFVLAITIPFAISLAGSILLTLFVKRTPLRFMIG